jgi:hypothetical protein
VQPTFAKYKFAFTPENSNDEGYVTEKIYDALIAGGRLTSSELDAELLAEGCSHTINVV